MQKALDELIRNRAGHRCEYCHAPQALYPEKFQIDHVIARQHKGATISENLCLCCLECNLRKGPNIAGVDPDTGAIVPMFHPRRDDWKEHFVWRGAMLIGLTASGRATIAVLDVNRAPRVVVRQALIEEGAFPPPEDRRE